MLQSSRQCEGEKISGSQRFLPSSPIPIRLSVCLLTRHRLPQSPRIHYLLHDCLASSVALASDTESDSHKTIRRLLWMTESILEETFHEEEPQPNLSLFSSERQWVNNHLFCRGVPGISFFLPSIHPHSLIV
jgi:hypothetical protein